jgi:hypothetical protein
MSTKTCATHHTFQLCTTKLKETSQNCLRVFKPTLIFKTSDSGMELWNTSPRKKLHTIHLTTKKIPFYMKHDKIRVGHFQKNARCFHTFH